MSTKSIRKRRGGKYPHRINVQVSPELKTALARASDRYLVAEGMLAREAIERGLKLVTDALRKQARQDGRNEARNDADENDL